VVGRLASSCPDSLERIPRPNADRHHFRVVDVRLQREVDRYAAAGDPEFHARGLNDPSVALMW
jgi:hypothetical protein